MIKGKLLLEPFSTLNNRLPGNAFKVWVPVGNE